MSQNDTANGVADLVIHASSNIRVENIVSDKQISLIGDARNVAITDSVAQNISIDLGDAKYPLGSGAKRILLENITTCRAGGTSVITPPPTNDINIGMPNGPSSPVVVKPLESTSTTNVYRHDIVYRNIGNLCGGG